MSLRRYDLNLLTALEALLRHRNVTRAGKELGLSQSATSHALIRLRQQFNDQLLVQSGREMLLTHRAETIFGPLEGALQALERIVEQKKFDPSTSVRRFKVGTADYVAFLTVSKLMQELEQTAPGVTLHVTWAEKDIQRKLRANELDVALIPRGHVEDDDLHSQTLFTDDLVVIASADHPEIGTTLDRATYERLPHARFRRDAGGGKSFADIQLLHNQLQPSAAVLVSDFLLLPFVISGTRCVSLIHRKLAEGLKESARIRILEPPFATAKLHVEAYWSHAAHSDPGHRWFRQILFGACSRP